MFDLTYIVDPDKYDKIIADSADLIELDESFKESYLEIITRFYTLFESIFKYYNNLNTFFIDIKEGKYIEFTFEAILQDKDGKRLMVESVYHYGAMLLLLDRLIPFIARERILTCYLRYLGSSASPLHSKVTKLVKSTGYFKNKATNKETIPEKYPANYFSRFKIDRTLVESLINAMKDDDIYDMIRVYGNNPQHRSAALSNQASIIFCLLPFCPLIMDNQEPKMREICDKHFPDNWVIPVYGGVLVDLLAYWSSFPAAKKALENNIVQDRVESYCVFHAQELSNSAKRIKRYIVQGQLQEKEALDNVKELLATLRDANATIRWVMLHEHATHTGMLTVIRKIIEEN
jgi:WASH complex subunit strumpellin